ncbi:cytochrome P450 [Aspergillus multicolor]|uniref:cytochrome P450 n=1 Tax=Aspergillus multicolor TaxID=41759 RepID=UPI003CCD8BE1
MGSVEVLASLAVALLAVVVVALAPYTWASWRPKNFPPGPKALPLVGNRHLILKSKAFVPFHQWTNYGPIIGLKFGPSNVVILNDWRDVEQCAPRKARPHLLLPTSQIHRERTHLPRRHTHSVRSLRKHLESQRKDAQGLLTLRGLAGILPIQEAEAVQTAYDILRDPRRCYEHIERYTTAVILASVFGQRGDTFDSPNVQALYDVQNRFTALLELGAAPPVDGITFLRHIPELLAPWKCKAKQIRHDQRALYSTLYNDTKARMRRGIQTGCFIKKFINKQE